MCGVIPILTYLLTLMERWFVTPGWVWADPEIERILSQYRDFTERNHYGSMEKGSWRDSGAHAFWSQTETTYPGLYQELVTYPENIPLEEVIYPVRQHLLWGLREHDERMGNTRNPVVETTVFHGLIFPEIWNNFSFAITPYVDDITVSVSFNSFHVCNLFYDRTGLWRIEGVPTAMNRIQTVYSHLFGENSSLITDVCSEWFFI